MSEEQVIAFLEEHGLHGDVAFFRMAIQIYSGDTAHSYIAAIISAAQAAQRDQAAAFLEAKAEYPGDHSRALLLSYAAQIRDQS